MRSERPQEIREQWEPEEDGEDEGAGDEKCEKREGEREGCEKGRC